MEINDLRRIAMHPPSPRLLRTESRENAQQAQRKRARIRSGFRQIIVAHRPRPFMSKNRRLSATQFPYYHALTVKQGTNANIFGAATIVISDQTASVRLSFLSPGDTIGL